jgi:hypothetical protein
MRLLQSLHLVRHLLFAAVDLLELIAKAGKLHVEVHGACVIAVEYGMDEAAERQGQTVSLCWTVSHQLLVKI